MHIFETNLAQETVMKQSSILEIKFTRLLSSLKIGLEMMPHSCQPTQLNPTPKLEPLLHLTHHVHNANRWQQFVAEIVTIWRWWWWWWRPASSTLRASNPPIKSTLIHPITQTQSTSCRCKQVSSLLPHPRPHVSRMAQDFKSTRTLMGRGYHFPYFAQLRFPSGPTSHHRHSSQTPLPLRYKESPQGRAEESTNLCRRP